MYLVQVMTGRTFLSEFHQLAEFDSGPSTTDLACLGTTGLGTAAMAPSQVVAVAPPSTAAGYHKFIEESNLIPLVTEGCIQNFITLVQPLLEEK